MNERHTGQCHCGAVVIEATGMPVEMGYCHCGACRAYSGAPLAAFTLWKATNVEVTKGAEFLGRFKSSDFSERRYCTKCGGHVMTDHPDAGLTDVAAAKFQTIEFKPTVHLNYEETVLPMRDGLPKLKDFPAHAGGSGQTMPE
jgi:hypothetical protein